MHCQRSAQFLRVRTHQFIVKQYRSKGAIKSKSTYYPLQYECRMDFNMYAKIIKIPKTSHLLHIYTTKASAKGWGRGFEPIGPSP